MAAGPVLHLQICPYPVPDGVSVIRQAERSSTNRKRREGGRARVERVKEIPGEDSDGEEGVCFDNSEGMEEARHRVDGRV